MKFCFKCLQPDTRPNTVFDPSGKCPACVYFESLEEVDWDERRRELQALIEFGRAHNHSGYDCIIGVSGGKDSTRQALYIRDILKMKPLLVSLTSSPAQATQRGVDNLSNLLHLGFDVITIQPAPAQWRDLMRKGFFKFANWAKPTELALFSSVPRFAIAYQIPLIMWGENPALQLGDKGGLGRNGFDGNNIRNMNTLAGGDLSWILESGVERRHLLQYCYPSAEEMSQAAIQIVYLGYFWRDWSLINNGVFSSLRGLDVRNEPPEDIGEHVGITALDEDWTGLNQMIKFYKYGFGRTTDYVNEEIRKGTITRDEGIDLVERYDGTCSPKYIRSFCDYIDITVDDFWKVIDAHVNQRLFQRGADGKWSRRFRVGVSL